MEISKDKVLNLIAHLDGKSQIEFAIKQGGSRYCSLQVKKFEVVMRGPSWVLKVVSLGDSLDQSHGTVEELRQVIQAAPSSPLDSIKLVGTHGGWAWATKMTYPLFLTKTDEGIPLILVRCSMDDFCDFDGNQQFASLPNISDQQGLLID